MSSHITSSVRMPEDLRDQVDQHRALTGRSFSGEVVYMVRKYLEAVAQQDAATLRMVQESIAREESENLSPPRSQDQLLA